MVRKDVEKMLGVTEQVGNLCSVFYRRKEVGFIFECLRTQRIMKVVKSVYEIAMGCVRMRRLVSEWFVEQVRLRQVYVMEE